MRASFLKAGARLLSVSFEQRNGRATDAFEHAGRSAKEEDFSSKSEEGQIRANSSKAGISSRGRAPFQEKHRTGRWLPQVIVAPTAVAVAVSWGHSYGIGGGRT